MQSTHEAFEKFARYPFAADPIFKQGIASIIQSNAGKSDEDIKQLIGRARAFYYNKTTGEDIVWEDYVVYRADNLGAVSDPSSTASVDPVPLISPGTPSFGREQSGLDDGAPTPLSFTSLADMINSGQTHLIPNNEVIPDVINEAAPSKSEKPIPRKPWEANVTEQDPEGEVSGLQLQV